MQGQGLIPRVFDHLFSRIATMQNRQVCAVLHGAKNGVQACLDLLAFIQMCIDVDFLACISVASHVELDSKHRMLAAIRCPASAPSWRYTTRTSQTCSAPQRRTCTSGRTRPVEPMWRTCVRRKSPQVQHMMLAHVSCMHLVAAICFNTACRGHSMHILIWLHVLLCGPRQICIACWVITTR